MTNGDNRWDWIDEFKGERIYETREGRLRAIAHIIKEYLQIKEGVERDPKTVDDAMAPIMDMALNDKEFKKFTLENYNAFIYYDKNDAEFYIKKITGEMVALIKEYIDNPDNKELENKIKELESNLKDKNNNKK